MTATMAATTPQGPAVAGSAGARVAAGSSKTAAMSDGEIRKAMAYRVKYRVKTETGEVRRRLPLQMCGVHNDNRGGVYPQAETVKNLTVGIARKGFSSEEADHCGCCVQERPSLLRDKPEEKSAVADNSGESAVADIAGPALPERPSFSAYNRSRTEGHEVLGRCFGVDSVVAFGFLAHNHLLISLLCWLASVVWNFSDEEKALFPLTADGALDLAAAANLENFVELFATCMHGMLVEVLDWRIELEEPGACALISHALNVGHSLALRTHELTAVAVLAGACGLCVLSNGGVDFNQVKEHVRHQLDLFVDEADFPDFFNFIINLGANAAPYVQEILDFGTRFVDQKKRQLRLQAFVEADKIDKNHPRTKVASIKRAYRKKPQGIFCPSPDSVFHNCPYVPSSISLERILQYFHYDCKAAVAALGDAHKQATFFANVDVAMTEAFATCTHRSKPEQLRTTLLKAALKYYDQLVEAAPEAMKKVTPCEAWIEFESCRKPVEPIAAVAAVPPKLLPKVISFNVATGEALGTQDTRARERAQTVDRAVTLPWREWHAVALQAHNVKTNEQAAFRAVINVLKLIHEKHSYETAPIEVYEGLIGRRQDKVYVECTTDAVGGSIELPAVVMREKMCTLAACIRTESPSKSVSFSLNKVKAKAGLGASLSKRPPQWRRARAMPQWRRQQTTRTSPQWRRQQTRNFPIIYFMCIRNTRSRQ